MAERAQELLAGTGWLPEPLRTREQGFAASASAGAEAAPDTGPEPPVGGEQPEGEQPKSDAADGRWPAAAE